MPHRLITPLNYDQIDKLYTATYSLQQKLEQQLKQLNQSTWALQCATLNEQYKSALAGIHNKKVKYLIDELEYSELQAKTQHVDSGPY